MVLVFPVPAPARTRLLSSFTTQARRWEGVSGWLSTVSKNSRNAANSVVTNFSLASETMSTDPAAKAATALTISRTSDVA